MHTDLLAILRCPYCGGRLELITSLFHRTENGTEYDIWAATLQTPPTPSVLYYKFRVTDSGDEDFYSDSYADDHDNLNQGGEGAGHQNANRSV